MVEGLTLKIYYFVGKWRFVLKYLCIKLELIHIDSQDIIKHTKSLISSCFAIKKKKKKTLLMVMDIYLNYIQVL